VSNPDKKAVISFGKGVRLMSEEYYITELSPYGITQARGFRSLCRAICCPVIFLGRVGFVDPATFQICMKNLTLPGNKDFCATNAYLRKAQKREKIYRNKVDPDEIQKNWKIIVRAILDSRRIRGLDTPPAQRAAIRSAAEELTRFVLTMIPSHKQGRKDGSELLDHS
jgi:hypothetical protein